MKKKNEHRVRFKMTKEELRALMRQSGSGTHKPKKGKGSYKRNQSIPK